MAVIKNSTLGNKEQWMWEAEVSIKKKKFKKIHIQMHYGQQENISD